jgi:glycosyltransferase involved in cell wall biosynthesis
VQARELLGLPADAIVIPSRQDNLPNTGGLPDIVEHQRTGYLAKAFDLTDLAAGIKWVFGGEGTAEVLGLKARERAVALFSSEVIAAKYRSLYEQMG